MSGAEDERDALGRRKSPAVRPEFRRGRSPGNAGLKLPAESLSMPEMEALEGARSRRGAAVEARDRAMISVLYRGRLKANKLVQLMTGHYDRSTGKLTVPGTDERVRLDATTRELLNDWITERQRLRIRPAQPLFCGVLGGARGRPMTTTAVRHVLRERAERAGLHRRVTPEGLRKSGLEHERRRSAAVELSRPERSEFEQLLARIDDPLAREYVEEAMNCLAVDAFRAAVVLLWTGAVRTLQERAMTFGVADVNEALSKHHPNAPKINRLDDFANVRDSLLLLACGELGLLDKGQRRTLEAALGLRNTCGHPSAASPGRVRVEAFIEDVVGLVWP